MMKYVKASLIPIIVCIVCLIVADQILGLFYHKEILGTTVDIGPRMELIANDMHDYEVLTFGDSVFQQADHMYAEHIAGARERLLPLSTRYVTTLIGNYFLFKRYLRNHKAPKVVVIGLVTDNVGFGISKEENPGYDTAILRNFTNVDEILEIYHLTHDRASVAKQLAYRSFNFMYLFHVFKSWSSIFAPKANAFTSENAQTGVTLELGNFKKVETALETQTQFLPPNLGEKCFKDSLRFNVTDLNRYNEEFRIRAREAVKLSIDSQKLASSPYSPNFCVGKVAHQYFEKLIKLAADNGTRVVYTPVPITDSRFKLLVYSGTSMLVDFYFSHLESKHNNFYYADKHFRHLPDTGFAPDQIHFGPDAIQYFRELGTLFDLQQKSNIHLQDVFSITHDEV